MLASTQCRQRDHRFCENLSRSMGKSDQLRTQQTLWGTSFIDCDVRHSATGDCLTGSESTTECNDIGSCATEYWAHHHIVIEELSDGSLQSVGVGIRTVGQRMTDIGRNEGLEDSRVSASEVVGGKESLWWRGFDHRVKYHAGKSTHLSLTRDTVLS